MTSELASLREKLDRHELEERVRGLSSSRWVLLVYIVVLFGLHIWDDARMDGLEEQLSALQALSAEE